MSNRRKNAFRALFRFLLRRRRSTEPRFFSSYREALQSSSSAGYADDDVVQVVVSKTIHWKEQFSLTKNLDTSSAQTLLGIIASRPGQLFRVIDFGGGAGIHYFQTTAFLGSGIDIKWNVVETPEMVEASSNRLGDEQLRFFTTIDAAAEDLGKVDLVLSNSSLPYTPEPFSNLEKLLALRARHIYITRTPLREGLDTVILLQSSKLSQNGPGPLPTGFADREVQYPVSIVSRLAFERRLNKGYSVRFGRCEASSPSLGAVGKTQNYSYFCDLSSPSLEKQESYRD